MKSFISKFVVSILLATSTGVFLPMAAQAQTSTTKIGSQQNYVIQLNSADSSVLLTAAQAKNVQKAFNFSADQQFSNTYKFQSNLSLAQLQQNLSGQFKYLDVNEQFHTQLTGSSFTPDDPGFTKNALNIDKQWDLIKANFPQAWSQTTGDHNTVVAVIDTGVDASHEDLLKTHFKTGFDVLASKSITGHKNFDDNGHGTLISGVIAASTDNKIGIAGAAFDVSIMPIKALDSSGSGSSSDISSGIIWAADHGANVINLSLGGIGFAHDKILANAISYAYDKNVVIVAAAGNDVAITGGNLDKDPVFPICDDNGKNMVLGVTATDVNDLKPSFANFGKACVDVSAPGKRILSTINHDPATGSAAPNAYAYASGTSLAVPLVAAQAALLHSQFPNASNRQISDRILATATNIDNLNLSQCDGQSCKGLLGAGRIDVAKSLEDKIVNINDGDLVQVSGTNTLYYINGGKKQQVIPFVRSQRFAFTNPKVVSATDLDIFPEGSFAEPLDGTLIKSSNDPAVYMMQNGLRSPLTYQVFTMRGFKFSDVATLTNIEVGSWIVGSFVTPPDGTLIRSTTNPTVYWVVNGNIHAINYKFYVERGLNIFPVIYSSDNDISKFPKGDPYIL